MLDGVGKNYVRMQAAPQNCVRSQASNLKHIIADLGPVSAYRVDTAHPFFFMFLLVLVVIASGFGFGGSIPVILRARLAQGFAFHPINLRFSQEASAVRGTSPRS